MITFDQFVAKWLGKMIDFDGAYQGQCVDLFRQYIQDVLGFQQPRGVSGAADFWTNYDSDPNLKNFYEKISNTPTSVPLKGDVMLWDKNAGGGFGHVSVFIEGTASKFTSFDQNWPTLSKCTKTVHDYTNVYGWLRPKVQATEPSVPSDELDKLRRERDDNWNLAQEYKAQLDQAEATIKAFTDFQKLLAQKLNTDDQTTSIIGAVERFLVLEDQNRSLQSKYDEVVRDYETLEMAHEALDIQITDLRKQIAVLQGVEGALKNANEELELLRERKVIDRFTTSELIGEVFKRLTGRKT